jgi:zinc transport system permease protein
MLLNIRLVEHHADTMAHGTLLGVAIAGALSLPLWLGVAGTAVLLVGPEVQLKILAEFP